MAESVKNLQNTSSIHNQGTALSIEATLAKLGISEQTELNRWILTLAYEVNPNIVQQPKNTNLQINITDFISNQDFINLAIKLKNTQITIEEATILAKDFLQQSIQETQENTRESTQVVMQGNFNNPDSRAINSMVSLKVVQMYQECTHPLGRLLTPKLIARHDLLLDCIKLCFPEGTNIGMEEGIKIVIMKIYEILNKANTGLENLHFQELSIYRKILIYAKKHFKGINVDIDIDNFIYQAKKETRESLDQQSSPEDARKKFISSLIKYNNQLQQYPEEIFLINKKTELPENFNSFFQILAQYYQSEIQTSKQHNLVKDFFNNSQAREIVAVMKDIDPDLEIYQEYLDCLVEKKAQYLNTKFTSKNLEYDTTMLVEIIRMEIESLQRLKENESINPQVINNYEIEIHKLCMVFRKVLTTSS